MASAIREAPCFHDLSLSAQLLVWATRHWMLAHRQRRMISVCVPRSFAEAGLLNAYTVLCDLLSILVFREYSPGDFSSTNAPQLSAHELRLFEFLLAVNRDDEDAPELLPGNTPPAVARQLVAKAGILIELLRREGHRLVVPVLFNDATSYRDPTSLPETGRLCRPLC
ncbi:MAG: hypothetical protein ACE5F8_01495 [Woeseiaceae bacterium]